MENEVLQEQFLTFLVAAEEYAVKVLRVKEILEYQTVTRVPKTAEWIKGVFNLRGSVIPVIDLAAKFGQGATSVSRTTCIVIFEVELHDGPMVMGMIVDSVSQVVDLAPEEIKPAPAFGAGLDTQFLLGVAKIGTRLSLLLDLDKVFSTDELLHVGRAGDTDLREMPAQKEEDAAR